MTFVDKILKLKPREESGSKTSRKYKFQKDLSLFILLEKHNTLSDYVFLFDFHEDLIILDSATMPSKASFYQMKSKDGNVNWTIKSLTTAENDKLSILGKLYLNKINFEGNTESLNFISNAKFSFKDFKDGTDTKSLNLIVGSQMHDDDIKECNDKIQKEHSLTTNPEFEKVTKFQSTVLSNADSSTHCIGKLSVLINAINSDNKINPELAYRQVINEIAIKTENTTSSTTIQNTSELFELKGITKEMFLTFLEKAGLYKSIEEEWDEIKVSLELCGVGYVELLKYKAAWREISATLIKDANKIPLQQLIDLVNNTIKDGISSGGITNSMNLIEVINYSSPKITATLYDKYFINALIIKYLNEK